MKRLDWVSKKYGKLLSTILHEEKIELSPSEAVSFFSNSDPSDNKKYTAWLVHTYLTGGYRAEDLPKAQETLTIYDRFKQKLGVKQRDIAHFLSLAQLWKAVKTFREEPHDLSGKEERRRQKAEARSQSLILFENNEVKIAIPLTEEASKWWGRGTRWCTAADRHNYFQQYHKEAPLFVIVFEDGTKWQIDGSSDPQFKDDNDEDVTLADLHSRWSYISPILKFLRNQGSHVLKFYPASFLTKSELISAILEGYPLEGIIGNFISVDEFMEIAPKMLFMSKRSTVGLDDHIIKKLIQIGHVNLVYDYRHLVDEDMCRAIVVKNPSAINWIPKRLITEELIELALSQCPYLQHELLEAELITEERAFAALKACSGQKGRRRWPKERMTLESAILLIEDGHNLNEIPIRLYCEELFLAAVKARVFDHYKIPDEMREFITAENANTLITMSPGMIRYADNSWITAEAALTAVRYQPSLLRYVPTSLYTETILTTAVKHKYTGLAYVPLEFHTDQLYSDALESDIGVLPFLPTRMWSLDLWLKHLKAYPSSLIHAPSEFLEDIIPLVPSLLETHRSVDEIPEQFRTLEVWERSLELANYSPILLDRSSAKRYVPHLRRLIESYNFYKPAWYWNPVFMRELLAVYQPFEMGACNTNQGDEA